MKRIVYLHIVFLLKYILIAGILSFPLSIIFWFLRQEPKDYWEIYHNCIPMVLIFILFESDVLQRINSK